MKLGYYDTGRYYVENPNSVRGRHPKDMVVLHETISGDITGLGDIIAVEKYLTSINFGIHGMSDYEGNLAWARGFGNAILDHAGGVNKRAIGIEQVAKPPFPNSPKSIPYWKARGTQLRATSKLLAAIANTWGIPLRFSNGDSPGITSHWNISQIFASSKGHTDCRPVHLGGYYPILQVIRQANVYKKLGYKL